MPLQKSYSDYVGASRNRSPWQRSKSNPVYQTPRARTLQPVSEATKSKLNKFQYHPRIDETGTETSGEDQKLEGAVADGQRLPSLKETADDSAATPVTRLTWRDLLEPTKSTEDEAHISPNDRLLWDNRQDALYGSALSPIIARKGRKRARSSSPISSPVIDHPNPPSVNVKKLAQALKSPHADPTLKLWDRYALAGPENANTPLGTVNPTLAQLMVSSSPRPSKGPTGQSGQGNLRRAISCGLSWPKRRKVERSASGGRANGDREDTDAASKSSLVTALLDTVTSSINGQRDDEASDSMAESPSPKKRRVGPTASGSPQPLKSQPTTKATSDYGDDDFDELNDDDMLELEASINATQLETPLGQRSTAKVELREEGEEDVKPAIADEFDDLDDDIFDEAEDLVVKVESQHTSQPPAKSLTPRGSRNAAKIGGTEDLDDEFGDAFGGDFDFDAVELAATQAVKQNHLASGDVCEKNQSQGNFD
ncbi:hypothetical protein BGZ63DRAFT_35040 [Mariannaea sp. PMI_226]|nr:hypothetical protein BGZ63DRAFT_35040 [Mariannaea sp. PMI_226]